MKDYVELCVELGIPARNIKLMDAFLIGGRIINDRQLTKKVVGSNLTRKEAIEQLTRQERAELYARVTEGIET